jgi:CBS domain-containing protein
MRDGDDVVLTVGDVMTAPVVTVTADTSFKEAVALLMRRRVSGLPVVDAVGNLVGIVSETDLLSKAEKRSPDAYVFESRRHRLDRARAAAVNVGSAMTREVTTARPDLPIALAAREMRDRGFKRLPVVDEAGKLVGIVSRGDLLKVFLRTDENLRDEIRHTLDAAESRLGGKDLEASVERGVVVLSGGFESRSRLEATLRAVEGIDGVIGTRNHMRFDVDDLDVLGPDHLSDR